MPLLTGEPCRCQETSRRPLAHQKPQPWHLCRHSGPGGLCCAPLKSPIWRLNLTSFQAVLIMLDTCRHSYSNGACLVICRGRVSCQQIVYDA